METANRALSAGSSQSGPAECVAGGPGRAGSRRRAGDPQSDRRSRAAKSSSREREPPRSDRRSSGCRRYRPRWGSTRANRRPRPAAQSTPTPSRSGDPTSFVTATHTADIDGVDAGGTLAARTLARTLETAPNPADLGDGARVGEFARGSLTRAPHSESAVLPSPEGTSQEPQPRSSISATATTATLVESGVPSTSGASRCAGARTGRGDRERCCSVAALGAERGLHDRSPALRRGRASPSGGRGRRRFDPSDVAAAGCRLSARDR